MNQPRITAKITFLAAAEGGRDELPANLSSGRYRPHVVIDPNQLRAVTVDSVPEETYFGVTFVNGPAQILPRQSFLADLVLMYWPNVKYEVLSPGVSFTIREGPHTVGYGRVESVAPWFVKDFPELADMKPPLRGTENLRRLVKAYAAKGVDHIKVLATERAGLADQDPRKRTFTDDELIAIVDEARKAGLKVAAHAHGDEGAYAAVNAGVRSIEHGTWVSDKTLRLMKAKGTWLVSNIFGDSDGRPMGSIFSTDPILVERSRTMWPQAVEVTRRAYQMGVQVVGATDIGYERYSIRAGGQSPITRWALPRQAYPKWQRSRPSRRRRRNSSRSTKEQVQSGKG